MYDTVVNLAVQKLHEQVGQKADSKKISWTQTTQEYKGLHLYVNIICIKGRESALLNGFFNGFQPLGAGKRPDIQGLQPTQQLNCKESKKHLLVSIFTKELAPSNSFE